MWIFKQYFISWYMEIHVHTLVLYLGYSVHYNLCHAVKVPRQILSPRPKTAMVHLLNWFHFAELGPPILPMKMAGTVAMCDKYIRCNHNFLQRNQLQRRHEQGYL